MLEGGRDARHPAQILDSDPSLAATVCVVRWQGLTPGNGPAGRLLADRAAERFLRQMEAAATGAFDPLAEVLALDPLSLLHAVSLVADPAQRQTLAEAYRDIAQLCADSDISLMPVPTRPLAGQMMAELGLDLPFAQGEEAESEGAEGDPLVLNTFSPAGFARAALTASQGSRQAVPLDDPALHYLSRSSLLMAARRRNLSEAGLLLLSHRITFPNDDLSHVQSWLARIERSDGLYGGWDLFGDCATTANLAASVTCRWACQVSQTIAALPPKSHPAPRPAWMPQAAFTPLPVEGLEVAIARLKSWVDANFDTFLDLNFSDQTTYGKKIKPLVELILALWLVTKTAPGSPHAAWAKAHAETIESQTSGEGLVEAVRIFPTTTLAALMFPMLEQITGRPHACRDALERVVRDPYSVCQERIPMRQMDYHFLCWLFSNGAEADSHAIAEQLTQALVSGSPNPCYLANDSLYDITHAIFYATKFGHEPFDASPQTKDWCAQWIPELCGSYLLEEDLDVGGELLMNWMQLGLPRDHRFWFAVRMTLLCLQENGAAPGPKRMTDYSTLNPFERDYHTTLIVLITLLGVVYQP